MIPPKICVPPRAPTWVLFFYVLLLSEHLPVVPDVPYDCPLTPPLECIPSWVHCLTLYPLQLDLLVSPALSLNLSPEFFTLLDFLVSFPNSRCLPNHLTSTCPVPSVAGTSTTSLLIQVFLQLFPFSELQVWVSLCIYGLSGQIILIIKPLRSSLVVQGVKGSALSPLWLWFQLWWGFDPWHKPWTQPKINK